MNIKKIFVTNGRLRAGWRICIFILLCIPIVFLSSLPRNFGLPRHFSNFLGYLILFCGILAVSYLLAHYLDKRAISTIGFMFHSRWLKEYMLGVLIGFVLVSILFLFEFGMGFLTVKLNNISSSLLMNIFLYSLIIIIFQSAFEELCFRGYVFQNFIEGTNAFIATAILSALFGIAHLANPNSSWVAAFNITAGGVLLALCYIRTKSLWLPSGLHFGWNFFMGRIYSLPVSGGKSADTLLIIQRKGPTWLTGGDFGPEAGIPALIIIIALCFLIYYWPKIIVAAEMKQLWKKYEQEKDSPPLTS
jgi:membrane protease YdiL (CAAX protease family)